MNKASHALIFLAQPHRLRVRVAALFRPQIPDQFIPTIGQITDFCISHESITLKITAGVVAVQAPVLHTDPTEFLATLAAVHVVAAFVLLYRRLATGALLRVRGHPQSCKNRCEDKITIAEFVP